MKPLNLSLISHLIVYYQQHANLIKNDIETTEEERIWTSTRRITYKKQRILT